MHDLNSKTEELQDQLTQIECRLSDPDLARDPEQYAETTRQHRTLTERLEVFRECVRLEREMEEARELVHDPDPEIAEMAQSELDEKTRQFEKAERHRRQLLLPSDPNDRRNTILEIRAGTGGEEAALFAGDLLRMYMRYAELRGWKIETLSSTPTTLGGFKEVIVTVIGDGAYSRLKFEGGTHRVQRVPATETQGRIHTSAVTVAVMPEAKEVEVDVRTEDLKIDVFRSSGPGGQSVNTTDSAVRVTHLPTGLVVTCQDEKSQHKNKAKALKVLCSRLLRQAQEEHNAEVSAQRKAQVGSGDRSGRIRTYNFSQNRISDHRITLTLYNLDQILDGGLDAVIDPLVEHHQMELLRAHT